MTDYLNKVLKGQLEAALSMLSDCVALCPPEHWDAIIGKYPFWQVAYHTVCFADLYLSSSETVFEPRAIHPRGMQEFDDEYPSRRFEQREIVEYLAVCRAKVSACFEAETREMLEGTSGFHRYPVSRGEMHIINIRHIQHHTAQLSASLRSIGPAFQESGVLRWARTGWRQDALHA